MTTLPAPHERALIEAGGDGADLVFAAIRGALAEAQTITEINRLSLRARAISDLARQVSASHEVRYRAARLTAECERTLALALRAAPKAAGTRGLIQPGMRGTGGAPLTPPVEDAPTLAEQGISKPRAKLLRDYGRVADDLYRAHLESCDERQSISGLAPRRIIRIARDEARRRAGHAPEFSPIIKPSDSWNFSQPLAYPKLEDGTGEDEYGYIPGDLIANALFYFARPDDVVVDPMAGSGMTWHVYRDRARWMGRSPWDLDVRLFDLDPRGRYAEHIRRLDLTSDPPPVERADYILIDPPYYGISRGCYGDDPANLAGLEWPAYRAAMARVAAHCAAVQPKGGRLTLITPDYTDVKTGETIAASYLLTRTFDDAGYDVLKPAYSTRRIQQKQGHDMAVKNNLARRSRVMLTDISSVVTLCRA